MNYWKSVASVLTGTVVAQVIPVLGSLVIARLFNPSMFGIFSAWLGLAMLGAMLLTCRFDMALAIEDDGPPRQIAVLGTLSVALMIACLVALIMLAIYLLAPQLLSQYPVELLLLLLPMALMFAVSNTWQLWAAAEGKYHKLNVMRITQAFLVTVLQILVGLLFNDAWSLAFAQFLGVFLSCCVSFCIMPLQRPDRHDLMAKMTAFWRRNKEFPLFSLPADFINTAAAQLPVLVVASRFGADVAGLLAMTIKVLGAPIGLLGKSVLDVFRRHAASSYRSRGECRKEYIGTFKVLALGSMAFCLFMAFFVEPVFVIAFGDEWAGSGVIALWLLPMFAMRFIASPLSYMVYIAGKQHLDLLWQITLLGMTTFSLYSLSNYQEALIAYSAGYSILYMIYLLMSYRFSLGVKS